MPDVAPVPPTVAPAERAAPRRGAAERPLGFGAARRRLPAHLRRLAPAVLTTLLGVLATLWIGATLAAERRTSAVTRAAAVADSLEAEIHGLVLSELRAFDTLVHLHEQDALAIPRLAELGAERFGFVSLESIAAPATRAPRTLISAPPLLEIQGASADLWLRARVDVGAQLASRLDERAPDYAIRVREAGRLLYSRGEAAPGRDWWTQTRRVELPAGAAPWALTLSPTPELARLPVASLPAYLRTAGVLISLLLGAFIYQAALAHTRAEELERSHSHLEAQARELRGAEEELRHVNTSLERRVADRTSELDVAVADLEAFTYSVSHDLRSPLGAVVNFSGILHEDHREQLDAEGRDHLKRLTASALSALAMMDGLAALSRVGRARPQIATVDLAALAADVFDEVLASTSGSGPRLAVGELPCARGDAAMLRTVFTNLFTNAVKFAHPARTPVVELTARRHEREVVCCVADNGVGFDPRYSQRLFRVFERLHTDSGYSGTGIGLAVVARVIRFHGGRVWAEGVPDEGARFYFTLPAEEEV